MRKKIIKVFAIIFILCLGLYITNTFKAIGSIVSSYISKVDDKFIIEQGEWTGQKYGIISFYDKTDSISNHIIYRQFKPIYKVKRLNKYFNEMTVLRIDENKTDVFTSTEEMSR